MRDFNFQALQPLLTVFGCLFCRIYGLEAARRYDFGTSDTWLGLLYLSSSLILIHSGQSCFLLVDFVNVLKWWCMLRLQYILMSRALFAED